MASVKVELKRKDKSTTMITAEYRVRGDGYSFKVHTKVYNGSKWRCPVRLTQAQQFRVNSMLMDERNAYLRELYAPFITEDELQFAFAKLKEQMS